MSKGYDSSPDLGPAPDDTSDAEQHEGRLALVRKLMLALKKDDEEAVHAALEDFIEECTSGGL